MIPSTCREPSDAPSGLVRNKSRYRGLTPPATLPRPFGAENAASDAPSGLVRSVSRYRGLTPPATLRRPFGAENAAPRPFGADGTTPRPFGAKKALPLILLFLLAGCLPESVLAPRAKMAATAPAGAVSRPATSAAKATAATPASPAAGAPAAPAGQAASAPAPPGAVMAVVNGQPIGMDELVGNLIEAHGLPQAEVLVYNVLVAQEASRRGVSVTDVEAAAEEQRVLTATFGQLEPAQRQRALEMQLRKVGLTQSMWQASMRRNAMLRKMALPSVAVTDDMLQGEYAAQYGEKVEVRHIQLPMPAEAQKVIDLLKAGGNFEELARKYSTNSTTAAKGGMLGSFHRENAAVPRAIREAAFELQERQVSGIVQVGKDVHVLQCTKRYKPSAEPFQAVRDKLYQDIQDRQVERIQGELLSQLRQQAKVEFLNPLLKKLSEQPRE